MKFSKASLAQFAAANPKQSSFVSANAGSGKTTVLAQRIARLLLMGVSPAQILCVTYTKAAAGEVQNRVLSNLGAWVLLEDEALRIELRKIGELGDIQADDLDNARRLFAQALEAPGGIKIQTIHAFAASILRQFPLEAGVAPGFQEMDETQSDQLMSQAIGMLTITNPQKASEWKDDFPYDDLTQIKKIIRYFKEMPDLASLKQSLGISAFLGFGTAFEIFQEYYPEEKRMVLAQQMLTPAVMTAYLSFEAALKNGDHELAMKKLKDIIYTGEHTVRDWLAKRLQKNEFANCIGFFEAMRSLLTSYGIERFLEIQMQFHQYGCELHQCYQNLKRSKSLLDYDDLIEFCQKLLNQNDRLNWVMYRLDGGIEHILVDEAQDTNPDQWLIIDAIAKQLPSAHARRKTLFVVGDEKQSIFGFQGADPKIFMPKRDEYKNHLSTFEQELHIGDMATSFRSSPLVLNFVDEVFSQLMNRKIEHFAKEADLPGQIEIWPFIDTKSLGKSEALWPNGEILPIEDAETSLAHDIAAMIAQEIAAGKQIYTKGEWRAVRPGDYLILTLNRKYLYAQIQKELQRLGVPIAGVDRMELANELCVKDVMALLKFVHAPYDLFSLACFLKSPICGLDDQDLYRLISKEGGLIEGLQQSQYAEIMEMISFVRAIVDYERPFDILSKFILRFDIEARLRARLGNAVSDALDALLDLALTYESNEAPSLAGFIAWFDQQNLSIKRDLSSEENGVRAMTVHGAKGLEAPIVIAAFNPMKKNMGGMKLLDDTPIYQKMGFDFLLPEEINAGLKYKKQDMIDEYFRLNYVALTRAQTRLIIICLGSVPEKLKDDTEEIYNLHGIFMKAIERISGETKTIPFSKGGIISKSLNFVNTLSEPFVDAHSAQKLTLHKIMQIKPEPNIFSLSELLPKYQAQRNEDSRGAQYGVLVHKIIENWNRLQHHPDFHLIFPGEINLDQAHEEARDVMGLYPELSSPDCSFEVALNHRVFGGKIIHGRMDAIIINGKQIRIIDFKTEIETVSQFKNLNERYQMQLAFYWHHLHQLYPDYEITAEIIWTYSKQKLVASQEELFAICSKLNTYLKNQHAITLDLSHSL